MDVDVIFRSAITAPETLLSGCYDLPERGTATDAVVALWVVVISRLAVRTPAADGVKRIVTVQ